MIPVFARTKFPDKVLHSIFLAGPTPRKPEVPSWRPEALKKLAALGYEGHVFVPETAEGRFADWAHPAGEPPDSELPLHEAASRWKRQVLWEEEGLNRADTILFWIPRDMATMPALTTNNEFGNWVVRDPSKVVLAAPPWSAHTSYQIHQATEAGCPVFTDLDSALEHVVKSMRVAHRRDGQCEVPAHIWQNQDFQNWYSMLVHAGNELRGGRLLWTHRVGPKRHMFCFAYLAKVWVAAEQRLKDNEFVFSRPNVSTVVAYCPSTTGDLLDTEVVLVKEFRTPGATYDGYVWEPPGGSSFSDQIKSPRVLAAEELFEETGIQVSDDRLKYVRVAFSRQVCATLSTHRAFVFSLKLTPDEMRIAKGLEDSQRTFGVAEDTERTTVAVCTLRDIILKTGVPAGSGTPELDWSSIGQIFTAIQDAEA